MSKKLTQDEFITRVASSTNNKVDVSEFVYVNSATKGKCKCKMCGHEWYSVPHTLLAGGGCPMCGRKKNIKAQVMTKDDFINRAKSVHGDKYDYSRVVYINSHKKVEIICTKHGSFFQAPTDHLRGHGCNKCASEAIGRQKRKTTEEFIQEYRRRYPSSKLDLSQVDYKTTRKPITVICKEHGTFNIQPQHMLKGCGCPICSMSNLEKSVMTYLEANFMRYERIKRDKWLGLQTLDFYLPDLNVGIECQGDQHFKAIDHFGGKEKLDMIVERDERKKRLCKENGVNLIYVLDESNAKFMEPDDTYFTDVKSMAKYLQNLRSKARKPRSRATVHQA